jgi:hypothetical protein
MDIDDDDGYYDENPDPPDMEALRLSPAFFMPFGRPPTEAERELAHWRAAAINGDQEDAARHASAYRAIEMVGTLH